MKNILLDAHSDDLIGSRLAAAELLAKSFRAKIISLQTLPHTATPVTAMRVPEAGAAALELAKRPDIEAADRCRLEIVERFRPSRTVHWERAVGDRGAQLLVRSRLADLCIVSIDDLREFGGLPGTLPKRAGSPILAMPSEGEGIVLDAPILVAWDGSVAASSALKGALPLLRRSGDVKLVSIGRERNLSVEAAIDYLALYGVSASADVITDHICIASTLSEEAERHCAGLVVMGATGHGIIRHTFLGSVARGMLDRDRHPLFLAH